MPPRMGRRPRVGARGVGDRFVFRPDRHDISDAKNVVSNYVADVTWPPEVGPFTAKQGRATWVVAHLDEGTPARVLLDAAGVRGSTPWTATCATSHRSTGTPPRSS